MKVTAITITALAVDMHGNPTDEPGAFVNIPNPAFPLDVPLEVYVPPCNYQIRVVVFRDQGLARTGETMVNACENTDVYMTIDSFSEEELLPEECPLGTECPPLPEECPPGTECLPTLPTSPTPLPTPPPTPSPPPLP